MADATPLSATGKRALYARVASELETFFAKYRGVDVTGRMATIKCVVEAQTRVRYRGISCIA